MKFGRAALALLPFLGSAFAQQSVPYVHPENGLRFQSYTEPTHGITFRWVFPPLTSPPSTEFIGELVAPASAAWSGFSLGGSMTYSLLIVAWPNAGNIVFSPRWTTAYSLPPVYVGPTITTISSSVTGTQWRWLFRCQGCTSWTGGSLDTNAAPVLSWVFGESTPAQPANPASSFFQHTDFGFWAQISSDAHDAKYSSVVGGGGGGTTTSRPITTSTTSRPITTSTTSRPITTSTTSRPITTSTTSRPITTTSTTSTRPPTTTTSRPVTTTTPTQPTQTQYGQCGGNGWTGPTLCPSGWRCVYSNDWYSQCLQ